MRDMPLVNTRPKLSKVAIRTPEGPRCPACNGNGFEPCRSAAQKIDAVLFVPALLFQKKKHLRCVTCGSTYRRG